MLSAAHSSNVRPSVGVDWAINPARLRLLQVAARLRAFVALVPCKP